MALTVYDLSAGLFVRGLTNLKALLRKAESHVAASGCGEAALLSAQLAPEARVQGVPSHAPGDVHMYTLAVQVHWAAEGARLAIARLLGASPVPSPSDEESFAELQQHLDATIAQVRDVSPSDLEAGLERAIVIEHRRGSLSFSGDQFLREFAIPHFFYHLTTAYGILRNQGVQLTMGDFLGSWGTG